MTGTFFRDGYRATAGTCRAWFPLANWPLCWLAALETTGEVSGRFPLAFLGTEQSEKEQLNFHFPWMPLRDVFVKDNAGLVVA